VNEDSVVQLTKNSGQSYLHLSKNNLVILSQSGQRISSELADKYVLRRQANGNNGASSLEALRSAGVDFVASGAAWNLEIDTEKTIRFRTNNNKIQLTSQEPTVQKLPGGKGSIYRAITEAGTLAVRITNQPCSDKASGQTLPYTVEVTANAQAYEGCGQFLTSNQLSGKWTIQEMNGQALNAADFSRGLPELELQPETNKASGNGGCNRISGEMKLQGEQVTFSKMISTRMACPGPAMTFENAYLQLLSDKTFTYQIQNDQLTLKDQDKAVLVYKKSQ
jgi:heat shock protein HslJ